ncbi:hypothetical protein [Terrabacter terrigena]|uniref:PqqD family protein n=1 Tax=Terrabacter terrigena TaxID=574718 RepID=A0ABW3MX48_9MICO
MSADADLGALTRLCRGDVVDELSTDDGTVVLVGRRSSVVVRLSPLGREILAVVEEGLTLAALESELRSRLGEPQAGDAAALVRAAVVALLEHAVIVVDGV